MYKYSLFFINTVFLVVLMSIAGICCFFHLFSSDSRFALSSVSQFGFLFLLFGIRFRSFLYLLRNIYRSRAFVFGIAIFVALSFFILFVLVLLGASVFVFMLKGRKVETCKICL